MNLPSISPEQWFREGAWKNGLQLDADPSTNIDEFYKQYHAHKTYWDQAFAFLKDQELPALQPGKYEIDNSNVYAAVSEAPNMDLEKTEWESHRKYNDIQFVISGKERIGVTTRETVTVSRDYDESRDILFYTGEGPLHDFQPGKFFIFFPEDIHRPGIRVDDYSPVKKIVLKIKTAL